MNVSQANPAIGINTRNWFTDTKDTGSYFELASKQVRRLDWVHRGQNVTCLKGGLWITQEGDYNDYMLEPGESFTITLPWRVTVQAFDDAAFTVRSLPKPAKVTGPVNRAVFK